MASRSKSFQTTPLRVFSGAARSHCASWARIALRETAMWQTDWNLVRFRLPRIGTRCRFTSLRRSAPSISRTASGADIKIEQRSSDEVTKIGLERVRRWRVRAQSRVRC